MLYLVKKDLLRTLQEGRDYVEVEDKILFKACGNSINKKQLEEVLVHNGEYIGYAKTIECAVAIQEAILFVLQEK